MAAHGEAGSAHAGAGHLNWYSLLGVAPDATTEQLTAAVERLARQANALAVTAPERARHLRDQVRAIKQDLLSGAEARQRYDEALARPTPSPPPNPTPNPLPNPPPSPTPTPPAQPTPASPTPSARPSPATSGPGLLSRISKFLQTGWTCGQCGYGALPTDKFCPKCGSRVESGLGSQAPAAASPAAGAGAGAGAPATGQAERPEIARCGRCGSEAVAGNAFCIRCGSRLGPGISRH
jgi:hypothetical protein